MALPLDEARSKYETAELTNQAEVAEPLFLDSAVLASSNHPAALV